MSTKRIDYRRGVKAKLKAQQKNWRKGLRQRTNELVERAVEEEEGDREECLADTVWKGR